MFGGRGIGKAPRIGRGARPTLDLDAPGGGAPGGGARAMIQRRIEQGIIPSPPTPHEMPRLPSVSPPLTLPAPPRITDQLPLLYYQIQDGQLIRPVAVRPQMTIAPPPEPPEPPQM